MSNLQTIPLYQLVQNSQPTEVAKLDAVREKFIQNYNLTHKEKNGELMYHRQMIHMTQIVQASPDLQKCDPFSLYACFVTAAVNGDSLDPQDEETYLIPLKGKAKLWPQAKSKVKRLRNSGQIKYADQAKLVYQGDEFEVENGRVKRHVEKFASEVIIAGYIRFVIDEFGNEKFFIFRKSDWEAWRKKSPQPNSDNWNGNGGQPGAAFLRTKIVSHACSDKSWSSDRRVAGVEVFEEIEIDDLPANGNGSQDGNASANSTQPSATANAVVSAMKHDYDQPTATVQHQGNDGGDW